MRLKTFCVATLLAVLPLSATAQETNFQLERFEPLPSQRTSILNVQRSAVLPDQSAEFGVFLHYTDSPLQLRSGDDEVISDWVSHQFKAEVAASIGLGNIFDIGLILPVVLSQSGDPIPSLNGNDLDSPVLSDARLVPKLRIVDPEAANGFGLALSAVAYIPTGNIDAFTSFGDIRVEPRVAFDYQAKAGWIVALNLAYQNQESRIVRGTNIGDKLRGSIGAEVPFANFALLATTYADFPLEDGVVTLTGEPSDESQTIASEADAALRWYASDNVALQVGGGVGITSAVGVPKFRVFGGLMFGGAESDSDGDGIEDSDDTCPESPEDLDGFQDADGCPDDDNDNDGVSDANDECESELEDQDGFEDGDGCPDPDNDQDGVADADDKCPNDRGPAKYDGCVPPDTDGDAILDPDDQCPSEAEDKDGFQDRDGCPDVDNDGDGFFDADDKCPNEAEVINGNADDDGCPDEGKTKVRVTSTTIEILEKIHFKSGKATIKKQSRGVLNQVASVLKYNTRLTEVTIEGHTDKAGSASRNLKLSKARAYAVKDYLVGEGVSEGRLKATWYGETKPISNDPAQNRRVEFKITGVGKPNTGSATLEETVDESTK